MRGLGTAKEHRKNASREATRAGTNLVVAIRAFNGALALQMPVHLHSRVEHVCARPNAAAAEVQHSRDSVGGERVQIALLVVATRLLNWELYHGCRADGTLAQQPVDLVCMYRARHV